MEQIDLTFLDSMFCECDTDEIYFLIVNQTFTGLELFSSSPFIRVINSYEKGLSISRNLLIENALGEICLIADDDVIYKKELKENILKAYSKFKNADAISFALEDIDGNPFYNYPERSIQHTLRSIKGISSVSISFKLNSIKKSQVKFNTLFGLGSYFPVGEEFIFIKDVLNKGLNVYFKNITILKHPINSTGKDMKADKIIHARAALTYKYYKNLAYPWVIKYVIYLVRKKHIQKNKMFYKIKKGFSGIKKYKELL
mgnify:CR=1 FL=1